MIRESLAGLLTEIGRVIPNGVPVVAIGDHL